MRESDIQIIDLELQKFQALLQAFGSKEVVKAFNQLIENFIEATKQAREHDNSDFMSFSLVEARVSLVNAIRQENNLSKLTNEELNILSSRPSQ